MFWLPIMLYLCQHNRPLGPITKALKCKAILKLNKLTVHYLKSRCS